MTRPRILLLCTALLAIGQGCGQSTAESRSKVTLPQEAAVLLPPGHPGAVSGNTLVLPIEQIPPAIHYANCFAGVPDPGDFGIGSVAGVTKDYLGFAILPVNINTGSTTLGAYRVRIEVSDPSVELVPSQVEGSNPKLSSPNCRDRGCSWSCTSYPELYPRQFDPAPGFEYPPVVNGDSTSIIVESGNADPLNPSSGVLNLINLKILVKDDLPYGGVTVTFTPELVQDEQGNPLPVNPISGIVIENFQLQ